MTDPATENPANLLADPDFVRRLARSLCGDEHVAEDVAQQTMVLGVAVPFVVSAPGAARGRQVLRIKLP